MDAGSKGLSMTLSPYNIKQLNGIWGFECRDLNLLSSVTNNISEKSSPPFIKYTGKQKNTGASKVYLLFSPLPLAWESFYSEENSLFDGTKVSMNYPFWGGEGKRKHYQKGSGPVVASVVGVWSYVLDIKTRQAHKKWRENNSRDSKYSFYFWCWLSLIAYWQTREAEYTISSGALRPGRLVPVAGSFDHCFSWL